MLLEKSKGLNLEAVANYLMLRMNPDYTKGLFHEPRIIPPIPQFSKRYFPYSEHYYLALLEKSIESIISGLEEVWVPLSGGLDSSTIVFMIRSIDPSITIYTEHMAFENTGERDEQEWAKIVADKFETEHNSWVNKDPLHDMRDLVRKLKEPKWTMYPWTLYAFCDGPIISGMGGDELFAGYSWKYKIVERCQPKNMLQKVYMYMVANNFGCNREILGEPLRKNSYFDSHFYPYFCDNMPYLDQFRVCDFGVKALWDFVYTEHIMAREFDFDIRYPFLNKEMIEFGLGIDTHKLVCEGLGKKIMRDTMIGKLPQEIILREKVGFGPNVMHVWETNLADLCAKFVSRGLAVQTGLLNPAYIDRIISIDRTSKDYYQDYKIMAQALALEYFMRDVYATDNT